MSPKHNCWKKLKLQIRYFQPYPNNFGLTLIQKTMRLCIVAVFTNNYQPAGLETIKWWPFKECSFHLLICDMFYLPIYKKYIYCLSIFFICFNFRYKFLLNGPSFQVQWRALNKRRLSLNAWPRVCLIHTTPGLTGKEKMQLKEMGKKQN